MESSLWLLYGFVVICIVLHPVFSQTTLKCTEQKGPCACNTDQGWINLEPLDSRDKSNPK